MRAFTATLGTETDTSSPIPTGWRAFEEAMLWRPGSHPDAVTEATGPLWACRRRARDDGWEIVEGTCAFAMPGGPIPMPVYEALRDEILEQLAQALPVDVVALGLHGAMVADGCDDCEGDLLERVRMLVGDEIAVGAVLDCHAHHTLRMQQSADVLIYFKQYPHTDYVERSEELLSLLERTRNGEIRPHMKARHCRMIAALPTTHDPIKSLVERMSTAERGKVLSLSLIHGFSRGDVPDMGSQVLAVTDDDPALAQTLADEFADELFALREELRPASASNEHMFESLRAVERFPVILVDACDNPGGGAAGDSVEVIRELLKRGLQDACIGPLWDPMAVRLCFDAGVGSRMNLRIGGKVGADSGLPLDAEVVVQSLRKEHFQRFGDLDIPLGDAAAVSFDGLDLVITSLRDQAYSPSLFSGLGIDCTQRKFIVLKSAQQFRIAFDEVCRDIFTFRGRKSQVEFKKVRRPLWPFDELEALPKDLPT